MMMKSLLLKVVIHLIKMWRDGNSVETEMSITNNTMIRNIKTTHAVTIEITCRLEHYKDDGQIFSKLP